MTDFTNYDKNELFIMLGTLLNETTQAVTEENDKGETKTTDAPIYTTGIGFDTESTTIYTDDTRKTIKDCFCYSYQVAVGAEHYAIYRTLEQFIEFLKVLQSVLEYHKEAYGTNAKVYIWVANLAHEWSFIKYRLMNEFTATKIFAKTVRDLLFIEFGDIQFRECIGLFGSSLADIAKNWTTTQKAVGDLDYDLIRTSYTPLTEQEKHYCINDVIILAEMHSAVLKAFAQENGAVRIPFTSSGFVRMKLKESIRDCADLTDERENTAQYYKRPPKSNIELIMRQNRGLFVSPEQWALCRNYGYSGGLCGSNIKEVGKNLKNVTCADLTSDYPAQLLHEKFPRGKLKEYDIKDYTKIKAEKRPYFILALVDFDSKTQHATFSKHKILNYKEDCYKDTFGQVQELIVYNGKVLHCKNAVVVLNDIDISAYLMIYNLHITPLKLWAFSGYAKIPSWLFDSISEDYINKAVLKHNGNTKSTEYRECKKRINSYYGVLATKEQDCLDVFCADNGLFKPRKKKSIKQNFAECWLNPYYAFWCTSYARRILMYYISKYPDNIIQYDTDSLYFKSSKTVSRETLEHDLRAYNAEQMRINQRIFKDNKNIELLLDLGCWDFEETYNQFLAMGAKKYVKQLGDKIETVIAGLPKSAIPSEIQAKSIRKPLSHYNVVRQYILNNNNDIIIEHMFAHKFASHYNDSPYEYKATITDHLGNTVEQVCGCYHAISPIDFTLSMKPEFLNHAIAIMKHENGLL